MVLDPTARETNVKDSLKKYLIDNIYTAEGIHLVFDKQFAFPAIHKTAPTQVNRWVTIVFGAIDISEMSTMSVDLFCCTREDPEGYRSSQLRDTIVGYLTDSDQTDTTRRIPFYRSRETGAWSLLSGAILVQRIIESGMLEASDQTKYRIITLILRWPSKV
uniref:Uncharacterized protein n=1 Tax=viral metagenome TaxID=1070528 RepID=A0A6M3J8P4_9ZZZZ